MISAGLGNTVAAFTQAVGVFNHPLDGGGEHRGGKVVTPQEAAALLVERAWVLYRQHSRDPNQ